MPPPACLKRLAFPFPAPPSRTPLTRGGLPGKFALDCRPLSVTRCLIPVVSSKQRHRRGRLAGKLGNDCRPLACVLQSLSSPCGKMGRNFQRPSKDCVFNNYVGFTQASGAVTRSSIPSLQRQYIGLDFRVRWGSARWSSRPPEAGSD